MKVIFLDIDGVLNTEDLYRKRTLEARQTKGIAYYEHQIDPDAVARLQRIVEATGADIVVSSSWRIIDKQYEALCIILERMGCTATVLGRTGRHLEAREVLRVHDGREISLEENIPRGWEIETWMLKHPGVTHFCIIDDDSDMDRLQRHLVRTSWRTGLTDEHVRYAINLLLHGYPEDLETELVTEKDHEWHTAGSVWIIPEVYLTKLRDGKLGISMLEANRVHRIIEQRLLKREPKAQYSDEELEFLMDIGSLDLRDPTIATKELVEEAPTEENC